MKIYRYPKEDAVYIKFSSASFKYGKDLDDKRHLNFSAKDELIGIEFLSVSQGVELDDIPGIERAKVASELEARNIKVYA